MLSNNILEYLAQICITINVIMIVIDTYSFPFVIGSIIDSEITPRVATITLSQVPCL
jgi:hypothetical protein